MKIFKWVLIVAIALALISYGIFALNRANTKKFSPEDTISYIKNDLQLSVFYNRPFKKGRPIFGALVPFGEVWRTGANEATVFTTNKDLMLEGQVLPAGKYTLWTIPNSDIWEVIFNSKQYVWGVDSEGKASRDPAFDVLNIKISIDKKMDITEQFTIYFTEINSQTNMVFEWDQTKVSVPIQ
ncbi:MAG: hypothetical protein CO119_11610 [Flavobacteriales bacterium CG_4_9_14_3_um_filter_40_17]|nr:MAG: hypothetical protein CO119_11610 [Flavobacteriales bacterium CG_4_9_14_3_um_filter_40_17]